MNPSSLLILFSILSGSCFLSLSPASGEAIAQKESVRTSSEDSIALSFVFVGCNRVGWSEGKGVPLPSSTANEPQLLQTFSDIKGLERLPEYFFFVGDLVRNEESGETLTRQLNAWQKLWKEGDLADTGIQLVPIAGNHEVLKSIQFKDNEYYELADATAYSAWLRWINGEEHPPQPGNGPTPDTHPNDLLVGDNQQFSYSLEARTAHGKTIRFVILNTDTHSTYRSEDESCCQEPVAVTKKSSPLGWIPVNWAAEQLQAPSDLLFVLGHKPIAYPATWKPEQSSNGRTTIYNCGRKMLARDLIAELQKSKKAVAYLCAHKHLWEAFRIEDSKWWQIIAGNGGSPLDKGDQFGFTLVNLYESGSVVAIPYHRPVPSPYYGTENVQPAQPGNPVTLKAAGWP